MKYVCAAVLLVLLGYGAWPYVYLYRLDRALMENDRQTLATLVDLDSIRATRNRLLNQKVEKTVGGEGQIQDMVRSSARWLGNAVEATIDLDWVRKTLRWREPEGEDGYPSIISHATFAFFDAPARFLVRIGPLGENPVHLRMALRDWDWRVTEIYD